MSCEMSCEMWDPKGLRPRWKLSRIEVVVVAKMTRMPYLYRSCSVREEWSSWRDRNVVSGFFAKHDVQLKASYGCWPPCMLYLPSESLECNLYTTTHTYTYTQVVYVNTHLHIHATCILEHLESRQQRAEGGRETQMYALQPYCKS